MRRVLARLSGNGLHNRDVLAGCLADGPVDVQLPDGRFPLAAGCVLAEGQTVRGGAATVVECSGATTAPMLHLLGSGAGVSDVTLEMPPSNPGAHDGDRCTAVTIGRYLYASPAEWVKDVAVERVRVRRRGRCAANSVAVMGAVAAVRLADIDVSGGGTCIAVHWGAVGDSVSTISGPSFHPNDIDIRRLHVRDAYEAFYLSSVYDVRVSDVTCTDVEIGFRLLPGDNIDHFHERAGDSDVSTRITITDCRIDWRGLYGVRIAGWGRSEVDKRIRRLGYKDVSIRRVLLEAGPARNPLRHCGRRAAIVVDRADGVVFDGVVTGAPVDGTEVMINGVPGAAAELAT